MGRVLRWRAALLLLAVVAGGVLWAGGRSGPPDPAAPPVSSAGGQAATAAARAAELDRRLRNQAFRLRVTTHPAGAKLRLRPTAGGPTRSGTTPMLPASAAATSS